jgi:hypothetical protein
MVRLLFLLGLLFSLNAVAAGNGTVSGYIKTVQIKESGYLLIQFEESHANPTECLQSSMVAIKPDSKVFDQIFSIALAAHLSHRKANFYTVLPCSEQYSTSYPVGITGAILDQ